MDGQRRLVWPQQSYVVLKILKTERKTAKLIMMIKVKFFAYLFGGLECVGHSFKAYVAHFVFFRDVWIRTQRPAVASRRATNLASQLPS